MHYSRPADIYGVEVCCQVSDYRDHLSLTIIEYVTALYIEASNPRVDSFSLRSKQESKSPLEFGRVHQWSTIKSLRRPNCFVKVSPANYIAGCVIEEIQVGEILLAAYFERSTPRRVNSGSHLQGPAGDLSIWIEIVLFDLQAKVLRQNSHLRHRAIPLMKEYYLCVIEKD
jgi:hypothetical protein